MSTPRPRGTVALPTLWTAGACVTLIALWRSGGARDGLQVPADPGRWQEWAVRHDPLDVAAGAARVVALVLVAYLLVVATLHLVAAVLPRSGVRRLAVAASPRFLVSALAGVVVLASSGAAGAEPDRATAGTPRSGEANPPVMRVLDPPPPSTTPTAPQSTTPTSPPSTAVASPSTPPPTTPSGTDSTIPNTVAADPAPVPAPTPARRPETEHVVRRGEHLWSIAAHTVTTRRTVAPTDAEIAAYWRRLIAANHERLADPDDPGLILPGQRLVLPS